MVRKIGQISVEGSQAGTVYSTGGAAPTICAGTHGYAIGYIITMYRPMRSWGGRSEMESVQRERSDRKFIGNGL